MHWHGTCNGKQKQVREHMKEAGQITEQQYMPDSIIRFQQETAYKAIMEVRYEGNIQDMMMEYDTLNVKARITGVAYRTMIMKELPPQIFKQLVNSEPSRQNRRRTQRTHHKCWKECGSMASHGKEFRNIKRKLKSNRTSFRVRVDSEKTSIQKTTKIQETNHRNKQIRINKEVPQGFKSAEGKTYEQMIEGVPEEEVKRRRAAKECLRCAWPSDRKGAHGTMKCFQNVKVTSGTADFVKPKTYQKMKVGGYDQLEDEPIDNYEIESDKEKEGTSTNIGRRITN